jgi:hypothetical protein
VFHQRYWRSQGERLNKIIKAKIFGLLNNGKKSKNIAFLSVKNI